MPPHTAEEYRQAAMVAPDQGQPPMSMGAMAGGMGGMPGAMGAAGGMGGGTVGAAEPWADALDEIDHRELAMGRFRARQEVLAEIFGPEKISE